MKQRIDCLKMFLFATCVYLRGNLRVRLTTQRKFLRKFNHRRPKLTIRRIDQIFSAVLCYTLDRWALDLQGIVWNLK